MTCSLHVCVIHDLIDGLVGENSACWALVAGVGRYFDMRTLEDKGFVCLPMHGDSSNTSIHKFSSPRMISCEISKKWLLRNIDTGLIESSVSRYTHTVDSDGVRQSRDYGRRLHEFRLLTPDKESSMSTLCQEKEFEQIYSRKSPTEKAADIEKTISVKEHERERYDFDPTVFYENCFWHRRPDGIGGQMA